MSLLKTKDTEYLRISGYVKGLENRLVCGRILDSVVDAADYASALNVLEENGFSCSADGVEPETVIERQIADVYSFFENNVPDMGLVLVFRIPRDYLNLKLYIKSEFCKVDVGNLPVPGGRVPLEELSEAVKRRSGLPEQMLNALTDASDSAARIGDPRNVEIICDKYCFREMSAAAAATGYSFPKEYVAQKADAANMSAFIRMKKADLPLRMFGESYVNADGCVGLDFYEEFYDKDLATVAASLPLYSTLDRAGVLIEDDIRNGRADALASHLDDFTVGTLRLTAFGPEVPFSYLVAKDSELRVLRVVLRGKHRGLTPEDIRERLGMSS